MGYDCMITSIMSITRASVAHVLARISDGAVLGRWVAQRTAARHRSVFVTVVPYAAENKCKKNC